MKAETLQILEECVATKPSLTEFMPNSGIYPDAMIERLLEERRRLVAALDHLICWAEDELKSEYLGSNSYFARLKELEPHRSTLHYVHAEEDAP